MSAAYQRDALWLGLYSYEHENWEKILEEYEDFARRYNGRPHWGKEFNTDKEYLQHHYPKFKDFQLLRQQMDPTNKFVNAYIERLFL